MYQSYIVLLNQLLTALWLFLPAGLANAAPVFGNKIPGIRDFSYPLDGFITVRNKRLLGANKTYRGLLLGTIVGIFVSSFQYEIVRYIPLLEHVPRQTCHPLIYGLLLGFGALAGDAVKSFIKRQRNIPEGSNFIPFDQMDYVIGGMLAMYFCIKLTVFQSLLLFIIWTLLHPVGKKVGNMLHLKSEPVQ